MKYYFNPNIFFNTNATATEVYLRYVVHESGYITCEYVKNEEKKNLKEIENLKEYEDIFV